MKRITPNLDARTVSGFGREWSIFNQSDLPEAERDSLFASYFSLFPWDSLPPNAEGFDMGCGSGRWAASAAVRVGTLHCVDASPEALDVARSNLTGLPNIVFHCASVGSWDVADGSMDFGYSLGVLHHVPDTAEAIASCAEKLKPGAPLLLYLYYRFDNGKPWYFVLAWRMSEVFRQVICRMRENWRHRITDVIAAAIYWPLARLAGFAEKRGNDVGNWPLSAYRNNSFYTMRTDALDRFGTRLEQRFTRTEIMAMMVAAGLTGVQFRDDVPYWCALGYRSHP